GRLRHKSGIRRPQARHDPVYPLCTGIFYALYSARPVYQADTGVGHHDSTVHSVLDGCSRVDAALHPEERHALREFPFYMSNYDRANVLQVNWPKLNPRPYATEGVQETMNKVRKNPVVGPLVVRHERGLSTARYSN